MRMGKVHQVSPNKTELFMKHEVVRAFLRQMVDIEDDCKVSCNVLYLHFLEWCSEQAPKPPQISKAGFGRILLNIVRTTYPISTRAGGKNLRVWRGIRLKYDETNYQSKDQSTQSD